MMAWTNEEINRIGAAEELQIAGLKADGSLCKPVTVWVVRVDDDLFVRSYRGRGAAWYRGTQVLHKGCIWAAGVEKNVTFVEESDPAINDQIDASYHSKYRRYPQYVAPMLTAEVRLTTLKLVPQTDA